MVFVVLAALGLIFGSFVNALVWRLYQQERVKGKNLSILNGRSQCPNCHHELAAKDLVPVLSWLVLRGCCRYCRRPISPQYPIVELAMAVVFVTLYAYWPGGVYGVGAWVLLITSMVASVGLLALLVYDLRWMLLPNKILYPTLMVAAAGRLIYIFTFEPRIWHALLVWLLSVLVASGLFWAIFMVSRGQWIGYGDVRLGLITGTLLASPANSFLMIFLAAVLGSLAAAPSLLAGKSHLTSRLPFGPFLIVATWMILLAGDGIIDRYRELLG